jgi:hypothetical protein
MYIKEFINKLHSWSKLLREFINSHKLLKSVVWIMM